VPTPAERRALLFVATVAALGVGVRTFQAFGRDAPAVTDREALARQLAAVDSAIAAGGRRPAPRAQGKGASRQDVTAPATSLAPASIDMDRAGVGDLDRLPGIGPSLAARIVADREERGPFGSIEGLQRVKGVGPALAARVQPYVTFSLPARPDLTEKTERPAHARRGQARGMALDPSLRGRQLHLSPVPSRHYTETHGLSCDCRW
jgi:competence protein ComEA